MLSHNLTVTTSADFVFQGQGFIDQKGSLDSFRTDVHFPSSDQLPIILHKRAWYLSQQHRYLLQDYREPALELSHLSLDWHGSMQSSAIIDHNLCDLNFQLLLKIWNYVKYLTGLTMKKNVWCVSYWILGCNLIIVGMLLRRKLQNHGIVSSETSFQKSIYKIIPMLFLVSTWFVLCTTPISIYYSGI